MDLNFFSMLAPKIQDINHNGSNRLQRNLDTSSFKNGNHTGLFVDWLNGSIESNKNGIDETITECDAEDSKSIIIKHEKHDFRSKANYSTAANNDHTAKSLHLNEDQDLRGTAEKYDLERKHGIEPTITKSNHTKLHESMKSENNRVDDNVTETQVLDSKVMTRFEEHHLNSEYDIDSTFMKINSTVVLPGLLHENFNSKSNRIDEDIPDPHLVDLKAMNSKHEKLDFKSEHNVNPIPMKTKHPEFFIAPLNRDTNLEFKESNEADINVQVHTLKLIRNEFEKLDLKTLKIMLHYVQSIETLNNDSKELLQKMTTKLEVFQEEEEDSLTKLLDLASDELLKEIMKYKNISLGIKHESQSEVISFQPVKVHTQKDGNTMVDSFTKMHLIYPVELKQFTDNRLVSKRIVDVNSSNIQPHQLIKPTMPRKEITQTYQNVVEDNNIIQFKQLSTEKNHQTIRFTESEKSALRLFNKVEYLLQNVHTKREIAIIAPILLDYIKEWHELSQTKDGNKALFAKITSKNQDILHTWYELIKTFQNRLGFKQNHYQMEAKVTTTDVIRWLSNHMDATTQTDERIVAQPATVSVLPISKVEQLIIHLNQTQMNTPVAKQLIEQFQKVLDANRIINLQHSRSGLSITLKPHNLGEMLVRFTQVQGETIVKIYVTTLKAKELLEGNIKQLRSMFAPHQVTIERQEMVIWQNDSAEKNTQHNEEHKGREEQTNKENSPNDLGDETFQSLFDELMLNEKV